MAKTKRDESLDLPVSSVPPDLLWDPAREVTVFAVVPCRGGHRLIEMVTSLEEACAYGAVSELDVGDVVLARAKRRMTKQAVAS